MHKGIVFDLDGTLTPIGKGMKASDIEKLRELEKVGYRIIFCSGKTADYLCGFVRQIGLEKPILVGENGGVIQFGIDLPPMDYLEYPVPEQIKKQLQKIRIKIQDTCKENVWFQPNQVELTPFPRREEIFDVIQDILDQEKDNMDDIFIYRHVDCFDLVPSMVNKKNGLKLMTKYINMNAEELIAVGDGINDVPMFEYADTSIKIGESLKYQTDYSFTTIAEALDYLLENKK